jgi:putative FmdB family regulatory protein
MPTYEYACSSCGKEFEVFQSMKDAPLTKCSCGSEGTVRRKIGGGAGIIFKGGGFYETDYKRKPSSGSDSSSSKSDSSSSSTASSSSTSSSSTTASSSTPKASS